METYGDIRDGNYGKAVIGVGGVACDVAKACKAIGKAAKVLKKYGGRAADAVRRRLGGSPDVANSASVCRGGKCTADRFRNGKGVTVDADGNLQNASVTSAPGKSVQELTATTPHPHVGVTTVGDVRRAGGDVIPDGVVNPNNPFHSRMSGISPEKAEELFKPTIRNPNK